MITHRIWSSYPVRAKYKKNNLWVPYLCWWSSILRAGIDSAAAAPPAAAERAASVAAPPPAETVAVAGAAATAVAAAATVVAVAVSVRLRLAAGSGYRPGVREESLDYPLPLHPRLYICKFLLTSEDCKTGYVTVCQLPTFFYAAHKNKFY